VRLYQMLLGGRPVAARDAVGWLVDAAAPLDEALQVAWQIALGNDHGVALRTVEEEPLDGLEVDAPGLPEGSEATEAARRAIAECVRAACEVPLAEAVDVQANHSAGFMLTKWCRRGVVGSAYQREMAI
jgi:hypothetical protein